MNRDVTLPMWAYVAVFIAAWLAGAWFSPLASYLGAAVVAQAKEMWRRLRNGDVVP